MQPHPDFLSLPLDLVSVILDYISLKRIIRISLSSKRTKEILRQSLLTFRLKLSNFNRPCGPRLRSAFTFVASASVHHLQRISLDGQSGVIGNFMDACFDLLLMLILQQDHLLDLSISLPYALIPNNTKFWTQLALSPKISSLTHLCVSAHGGGNDLPIILPVLANLQQLIINDHTSDASEILPLLASATLRLKTICLPPRTQLETLQPLAQLPELQTILLSDQLHFFDNSCKFPTAQSLLRFIDRVEKILPPKLAVNILFGASPYTRGHTTYRSLVDVAIFEREIGVLRRLIADGAHIGRAGEPSLRYWRVTPLETAILIDKADAVQMLLEAGAAVCLAAPPRNFNVAFEVFRVQKAIACAKFVFEFLLKFHADDLSMILTNPSTLDTIFHASARAGENFLALALPRFSPYIDINSENMAGWPPIAVARSTQAVEELLRHGADPNPFLKTQRCSMIQAMMTSPEIAKLIPSLVCLLESSARQRIHITLEEVENVLSAQRDSEGKEIEPYWVNVLGPCLPIFEFFFESITAAPLHALLDRTNIWNRLQSKSLSALHTFFFYSTVSKHCEIPEKQLEHIVAVLRALVCGSCDNIDDKHRVALQNLTKRCSKLISPALIELSAQVAPAHLEPPAALQTLLSWITTLLDEGKAINVVTEPTLTKCLHEIVGNAKLGDPDVISLLIKLISLGANTVLSDKHTSVMLIIAQRGFPNALMQILREISPAAKLLHVEFALEDGKTLLQYAHEKLAQRMFGWRAELVEEIKKHATTT